MFGDILIWVLTFFGLVPWDTLFGRKKDFQEQLAEFGDESNVCVVPDNSFLLRVDADSIGNSGSKEHTERAGVSGGYVEGPWGVVPYATNPDDDDAVAAIMRAYRQGGIDGYKCRVGRRL